MKRTWLKSAPKRAQERICDLLNAQATAVRGWLGKAKRALRVRYARLWLRASILRYRIPFWVSHHRVVVGLAFPIVIIAVTALGIPRLQVELEQFFITDERLESLRSFFVTAGGALIGAAAITLTLVMFAMQVNVERMPHGLFRKFSTDHALLGTFFAAFLFAFSVSALSLVSDRSWLGVVVFAAFWGIVLILVLFFIAYLRALSLISPIRQLEFVVEAAQKDLRHWARRARRAAPLFEQPDGQGTDQSTHDLPRADYYKLVPHWTNEAQRAVIHANSFARYYAERGDYEASYSALTAIVHINESYVEAKGKTFFSQEFLPNPLTTDVFINHTLEYLRQYLRSGVARREERQIEQALNTMVSLVDLYVRIDYGREHSSKTHAHLAGSYLSNAADSILPLNMPDVLMTWMRLMGQAQQSLISQADPNDSVTLSEKIGTIASVCITRENHPPVTLVGVEQLSLLTQVLIESNRPCPDFALEQIQRTILVVAKSVLAQPDDALSNIHRMYLSPYYSGIVPDSFLWWLTVLADRLIQAPPNDEYSQVVIRNVSQWARELPRTELKELFVLGIKSKSTLTSDLISWITDVTKLLLKVSNAACDHDVREDLRHGAISLIGVLGWVPDSQESVRYVENREMTETLFDVALAIHNYCPERCESVESMLLSWAFKGGKYETDWGIFRQSIYALSTLAIIRGGGEHCQGLKDRVSNRLASENSIGQELREQVAGQLRDKAETLHEWESRYSRIKSEMHKTDQKQLSALFQEVADILSPNTPS